MTRQSARSGWRPDRQLQAIGAVVRSTWSRISPAEAPLDYLRLSPGALSIAAMWITVEASRQFGCTVTPVPVLLTGLNEAAWQEAQVGLSTIDDPDSPAFGMAVGTVHAEDPDGQLAESGEVREWPGHLVGLARLAGKLVLIDPTVALLHDPKHGLSMPSALIAAVSEPLPAGVLVHLEPEGGTTHLLYQRSKLGEGWRREMVWQRGRSMHRQITGDVIRTARDYLATIP